LTDDDDDERAPESGRSRLGSPQAMAYEQRIGLARRMVAENPTQVAQVVKNWVGEDGG
jgi:flagellar M-ring protein FliF